MQCLGSARRPKCWGGADTPKAAKQHSANLATQSYTFYSNTIAQAAAHSSPTAQVLTETADAGRWHAVGDSRSMRLPQLPVKREPM
jgi:hypothetical protein